MRTSRGALARHARGFSLLELMLVLAIIGVLLAVVALNIGGFGTRGKIRATEASLATIQTASGAYHLEYSSYPPTLQTLVTVQPPLLAGTTSLQDGWGKSFYYKAGQNAQGNPYTLLSYGGAEDYTPEQAIDVWTMNQD